MYTMHRDDPTRLSMKNGLPYLFEELFWRAMHTLVSGHPWLELRPEYPNHTMKFGKYTGSSLQMLREEVWHSYDKDDVWLCLI